MPIEQPKNPFNTTIMDKPSSFSPPSNTQPINNMSPTCKKEGEKPTSRYLTILSQSSPSSFPLLWSSSSVFFMFCGTHTQRRGAQTEDTEEDSPKLSSIWRLSVGNLLRQDRVMCQNQEDLEMGQVERQARGKGSFSYSLWLRIQACESEPMIF